MDQQNRIHRRILPAELMNELFASMPFGNAFVLLAKMPNGLLARNVQKMINGIKETIKSNKLNGNDCGLKLSISEDGFMAKHSGFGSNSVRTVLPIPVINLKTVHKPIIIFYFEIEILNGYNNANGFCDQQFPLKANWLGTGYSIGIGRKAEIWINGSWIKFKSGEGFYREGDFVGIGIILRPNSKMECFATWNGLLHGKVKLPSKFAHLQIFPAVNLFNYENSSRVNFGQDKWQFKDFKCVIE